MRRAIFLTVAVVLSVHESSATAADKWPAPRPRIFAQANGEYAFKVLPDAASLAGRKSEGVYFTLDEQGQEKVIWRAKLVNIPHRVMLVQSARGGKYARYVITIDTWARIGMEHCLVVYGDQGKVLADFKLADLLTAKEIESLPTDEHGPPWSDPGVAEFEDRSLQGDELVIRLKLKERTKVLRLILSTGKIENGKGLKAGELAPPTIRILAGARTTASGARFFSFSCEASNSNKAPLMFVGYRADSFDPPIADGNMSPIDVIQILQPDGKWKEHPQGWCGTGIDGILLPAGRTKKFGFAIPADLAGKAVRVGIRWSRPQNYTVAKPESFRVAWSEPFELKRID